MAGGDVAAEVSFVEGAAKKGFLGGLQLCKRERLRNETRGDGRGFGKLPDPVPTRSNDRRMIEGKFRELSDEMPAGVGRIGARPDARSTIIDASEIGRRNDALAGIPHRLGEQPNKTDLS